MCTLDCPTHTRPKKGKSPRESSRHPGQVVHRRNTPRHVVNHASPTTCHSRSETTRPLLADSRRTPRPFQGLSHEVQQAVNKQSKRALVRKVLARRITFNVTLSQSLTVRAEGCSCQIEIAIESRPLDLLRKKVLSAIYGMYRIFLR